MRNRQVFIELRPTRLDVVVADHDRVIAARRIDAELRDDTSEWIRDVKRLSDPLERVINELGCAGMKARVIYQSPTQMTAIESLEVRHPTQCCEAARLECFDSLKYSTLAATSDSVVIGRDAHGKLRRTHAVAAVDRNDIVRAITDMVESAGLRFQSATPTDAAIITMVGKWAIGADEIGAGEQVRQEQESLEQVTGDNSCSPAPGSPAPLAVLYIGEQSSCLMIADRGNLTFARRLQVGVDSFVNALTNPIRSEGYSEPITLSQNQAIHILRAHGLPRGPEHVPLEQVNREPASRENHPSPAPGQPDLTGQQLIPLLQPLLQRFVVELRQSLRFGASGSDDSPIAIRCHGPGGLLRGLPELLEQELNVSVINEASGSLSAAGEPGGDGSVLADVIHAWRGRGLRGIQSSILNPRSSGPALIPREVARTRKLSRLSRWLWTGAAAAMVLIAFDAMRFSVQIDEQQRQADRIASHQHDFKVLGQTQQRLVDVIAAMRDLEQRIENEVHWRIEDRASRIEHQAPLNPRPSPLTLYPSILSPQSSILREVARVTPESIRLTRITLRWSEDGLVGALSGIETDQVNLEPVSSGDHPRPSTTETGLSPAPDSPVPSRGLSWFITQLRDSPLFETASLGNVHAGSVEGVEGTRFEATVVVTDVPAALRLAVGDRRTVEGEHP